MRVTWQVCVADPWFQQYAGIWPRLQHHAIAQLVDVLTVDFLPCGLALWILVAAAEFHSNSCRRFSSSSSEIRIWAVIMLLERLGKRTLLYPCHSKFNVNFYFRSYFSHCFKNDRMSSSIFDCCVVISSSCSSSISSISNRYVLMEDPVTDTIKAYIMDVHWFGDP